MARKYDPNKLSSPRIFLVRMLVFLVLCAPGRRRPVPADSRRLHGQSGPERADPRRAVDRHPAVVPAGDPAVPRSRLGQQLPARRSRHRGRTPAGPAGADGGAARRPARPHGDLDPDDARHPRFDRDPARRGARPVALHDRPADLPRPARHLLGPDRDRRFGRQGDGNAEARRRRRLGVRHAARRPRRAARRHGHLVLVLAVRPRRFARARLPRSADEPGAEPLLHRSRRLALDHGARHQRGARGARGSAPLSGDMRAAIDRLRETVSRDRRQQGRDRRDGQSRRGDPGPRAAHAHRAADDPRLGRFAGRAERRKSARLLDTCWRARRRKTMALARSRRDRGIDYWPGFVDALSTLVLGIIFLLSIFVGRAVLSCRRKSPARTPRCSGSTRRSRSSPICCRSRRPARPTWKTRSRTVAPISPRPKPSATGCAGLPRAPARRCRGAGTGRANSPTALDSEKQSVGARAGAGRIAQPADRGVAPPARRARSRARRLRKARPEFAERASPISASASTSRWRSACRNCRATAPTSSAGCAQILGNRPDIRIVGDRFVFQSEVFFDAGQAVLKPEGRAEIDKIATALLELEKQIPRRHRLGDAGRRPYRHAADRQARNFPRTGNCPRRARSRSCST